MPWIEDVENLNTSNISLNDFAFEGFGVCEGRVRTLNWMARRGEISEILFMVV